MVFIIQMVFFIKKLTENICFMVLNLSVLSSHKQFSNLVRRYFPKDR